MKSIFPIFLLLLAGCFNNSLERNMNIEDFFQDKKVIHLTKAALSRDADQVKTLISRGAKVNSVGKDQMTPLLFVYLSDNYEGYLILLKNGGNPNLLFKGDESIMSLSARNEDIRFLRSALQFGGDPNHLTYDGRSMLMVAATANKLENANLLIQHGAKINDQDNLGYTALIEATREANVEMVKFLLSNGANVRLHAGKSLTPYKAAEMIGHEELMELLRFPETVKP
jgi:ankyrin repeat/SAM/basic leucine zipper domain-containing protein 1